MKPPSNFKRPKESDLEPPSLSLELEWIHGYQSSKASDNLRFLKDGSVGYFAAGCTVVYDPVSHTQKIFNKHHDDVTAIGFSPDRAYIATGENGKRPTVFIVDSVSLTLKKELKGNSITNSVISVQYTPSGNFLGVLAGNDDHHVAIYDTKTW